MTTEIDRSLQVMLNNAYDGVIVTDEKGIVIIINQVAEKILDLKAEKLINKPIAAAAKANIFLQRLYGNGKSTSGEKLKIGSTSLIFNRLALSLGSKKVGLAITFHETAKTAPTKSKPSKSQQQNFFAPYRFSDIVGHSVMMEETIKEARKYARSEAAVLITGESGTGKELFAQSIHNESARNKGPFVAVNCASLPEALLESELFGYEEGAFTGAKKGGKQGLFSLADGGTIFLDEIGDLSPPLQARLLRVLQQKQVMPVGGQSIIPVDVRVISATNRDLSEDMENGDFRMDLYYRLNVLHLHVPPLRTRMEDVPVLFKHFYQRLSVDQVIEINDEILEELKTCLWPGNVRELQGFAERYAALGEEDINTFQTFKKLLWKNKTKQQRETDRQVLVLKLGNMEDMERQIIEQAYHLVKGSKGELARILGVSRTTLWKKLKKIKNTV